MTTFEHRYIDTFSAQGDGERLGTGAQAPSIDIDPPVARRDDAHLVTKLPERLRERTRDIGKATYFSVGRYLSG
jgi:hypothetical protein